MKEGQGIFSYNSGDTYFGGWKNNKFHGQGIYIFQSGEIYDGLLNQNCKEGIGTYYFDDGTAYYSGNWLKDVKHGTGVYNSPEEYYEGQWLEGHKNGSAYHKDKLTNEVYIGEFTYGDKTGKGRLIYADGSVYSGEIVKDQPHGVG